MKLLKKSCAVGSQSKQSLTRLIIRIYLQLVKRESGQVQVSIHSEIPSNAK